MLIKMFHKNDTITNGESKEREREREPCKYNQIFVRSFESNFFQTRYL